MSTQVLTDPTLEIVVFQWRRTATCYDCGLPAAFLHSSDPLCAVCAANAAANGVTISRIEEDEDEA